MITEDLGKKGGGRKKQQQGEERNGNLLPKSSLDSVLQTTSARKTRHHFSAERWGEKETTRIIPRGEKGRDPPVDRPVRRRQPRKPRGGKLS